MFFVGADKNSAGVPIIIASNEVSGTVSVTALNIAAAPAEEDPTPSQPSKDEPEPTQPSEGGTNKNENGNFVSPKTGDETDFVLWTALLLISSACALGAVVYGKKKCKTE